MKAAIKAGGDVNELDHEPDARRNIDRPLDFPESFYYNEGSPGKA
jgi:hypothetical protein